MRRSDMIGLVQHMGWADATVWTTILMARGAVDDTKLTEIRPIASNTDESGRSLDRRVEVKCQ